MHLGAHTDTYQCPDWYRIGQAAKYWGVPPWEMIKQGVWWEDKALIAMAAEAEAQKSLENHGK